MSGRRCWAERWGKVSALYVTRKGTEVLDDAHGGMANKHRSNLPDGARLLGGFERAELDQHPDWTNRLLGDGQKGAFHHAVNWYSYHVRVGILDDVQ